MSVSDETLSIDNKSTMNTFDYVKIDKVFIIIIIIVTTTTTTAATTRWNSFNVYK